jgi:predicted PurR-regulated permease PerM
MIPFAILGLLVVYVLNPFLNYVIDHASIISNTVFASIFMILLVIDFIVTLKVLVKIKRKIKTSAKDNTESIRDRISKWMEKNSYFSKRLKRSFPDLDIRGKIDYVENGIVKTVLIVNDSVVDLTSKLKHKKK